MRGRPKKGAREKDLTSRYTSGGLDEDRIDAVHRFTTRSKHRQESKTLRTSQRRAEVEADLPDLQRLPIGKVVQVYSQFCDVEHEQTLWLCGVRKTLSKTIKGDIVVGDLVRFLEESREKETGRPEATIEQILPRQTVLTRAESFKQSASHPIVANAEQMLIVTSLREPGVKWGLVDRMIVAAKGGGLLPIVCLNKTDLPTSDRADPSPAEVLAHYESLQIPTLQTSVILNHGIEDLRNLLRDRTTVLAGHSGVGKSSLIRAIQPDLDLRIGAISGYTGKGRHTTSSARRYKLAIGGYVIDTPGVKLFGLWGVTRENLLEHFPDIAAGTAPPWRRESYQRITESLSG